MYKLKNNLIKKYTIWYGLKWLKIILIRFIKD